ncbi:DUF2790 domain-containing protein [Azorhizophilus paspali]|uniref:DUF2790 domain-containing protein n=2 Tax=Azorhizophilus paspali TaxID=69963 RepID=A0ABV6SNG4_AZOPA
MNMKPKTKTTKIFIAMIVSTTASLAMADINHRNSSNTESAHPSIVETMPYKYNMNLDIAEPLEFEYLRTAPAHCGPIPARMTYKDSTGAVRTIEYLYPDTSGCTD